MSYDEDDVRDYRGLPNGQSRWGERDIINPPRRGAGMDSKKIRLNREKKLPDDTLGIVIDGEGFVCAADIKDADDIDDGTSTPIFNHDTWFRGDTCVRCLKIIEREPE